MKTVFKSLRSIILLMLMLLMPFISFAADTIRVNIPRVTVTMARSYNFSSAANSVYVPVEFNSTMSADKVADYIEESNAFLFDHYGDDVVEKTGATAADGAVKSEYLYSADGIKQRVVDGAGSNGYLYLGTLVLSKSGESYTLPSTGFGGGRIIGGTGNSCLAYYYGTDHLGSVRVITDGSGSVVERNDYYPMGMRTATGNSYPQLAANLYKYNGKEVQTVGGIGFTDYGARMYDDFTGRWFVPDPLAEKYASMSPYMYCGGNPIAILDIDGRDVWNVNKKGQIVNKFENKDYDAFYMVNSNGERTFIEDEYGNRHYNSIFFKSGTITNFSSQMINGKTETAFSIAEESAAGELFKFLSDNTSVEFALINSDKGSIIMTNHTENKASPMPYFQKMSYNNILITSFIHNHPSNSGPSGFRKEFRGDRKFLMNVKFNYGYIPDSYIYQPKYNQLVKYDINNVSNGTPWNSIFKSSLLRIIPNKTTHNKFKPINSYL